MELSPTLILVIGLVAAILTQGVKLFFAWIKKPIDRRWVSVVVLVIALVMGYFTMRPIIPAFPVLGEDAMAYTIALLNWIAVIVGIASALGGFAMPIYNLLMGKVFDAIGIGDARIEKLQLPK
jgi:hypothetical protein